MHALLTTLLFTAMTAGNSNPLVARQRVDLIELNHFMDDNGRHVFDQIVFYEWVESRNKFRVIAWRMVKRPSQLPIRTWNPRGWQCVWKDDQIMRSITAPSFRETWTQQDPERVNRRFFAESERPDLETPPAFRKP